MAGDAISVALPTLRFLTCGSVDDGKSTLIGRLPTSKSQSSTTSSRLSSDRRKQHGRRRHRLRVDGLEAEREQGITIVVAYSNFSTAKRSFVVANTPGYEQFTRNMATGASNADLAILLVMPARGCCRRRGASLHRGDVLADPEARPPVADQFAAHVIWMIE